MLQVQDGLSGATTECHQVLTSHLRVPYKQISWVVSVMYENTSEWATRVKNRILLL